MTKSTSCADKIMSTLELFFLLFYTHFRKLIITLGLLREFVLKIVLCIKGIDTNRHTLKNSFLNYL